MVRKKLPGIWLLEAFKRGGVDTDFLMQECSLELENLIADPRTTSPNDLNNVLSNCAKSGGDESFGLHMVNNVDVVMMGPMGYLQLNAPTVKHLLDFTADFFHTLYQSAAFEVSIDEGICTVEFRMDRPHSLYCRHQNEWSLGFLPEFISNQLGYRWQPLRAEFANDAPDNIADLVEIFGGDITFNSSRTAFEFKVGDLDLSLNKTDPHLLKVLTNQAEALMQEIGDLNSFVSMTRMLILEGLELGSANSSDIARRLAMSRSTFKRRLGKEGLSFRKLKDQIIQQVASEALINTEAEVGDVAAKLGYSELSAFDRAFKRLAGVSPSAFRRENGGSGH